MTFSPMSKVFKSIICWDVEKYLAIPMTKCPGWLIRIVVESLYPSNKNDLINVKVNLNKIKQRMPLYH